jgi:hypothetical protein
VKTTAISRCALASEVRPPDRRPASVQESFRVGERRENF